MDRPDAKLGGLSHHVPRDEDVFHYLAERYGVGHRSLAIECRIGEDGSAAVQRTATVQAYTELAKLDAFLVIPEDPPAGEGDRTIDPGDVRSLTKGWDLSPAHHRLLAGRLYTSLAITPPLREGETITYQMTERLPAGLYAIDLTAEGMEKRRTSCGYLGWSITKPTQSLSLNVHLPEGFEAVDLRSGVLYASAAPGFPTDRAPREVQERLGNRLRVVPVAGHLVLKLDVDYPVVGLVYRVRWERLERAG